MFVMYQLEICFHCITLNSAADFQQYYYIASGLMWLNKFYKIKKNSTQKQSYINRQNRWTLEAVFKIKYALIVLIY